MLSSVSLWGIVCLLLAIATIIVYGVNYYGYDTTRRSYDLPPLFSYSAEAVVNYFGVATFCVDICTAIFPVINSMKDQSSIKTTVLWSLCFIWVIYVAFGGVASSLFIFDPNGIQSNIISNLPSDSIVSTLVKICMALVRILC
jgi:amino acid permease